MNPITIRYSFKLADGSKEIFNLLLDPRKLELMSNTPESLPLWSNLDFHQCPNCPLDRDVSPYCPLAANLVGIVRHFDRLLSYDETYVDVLIGKRMISQNTTVQRGLRSLIGLVIATCGCPHTAFFKPMARFHLPFADEEETIYRATSMYLLAQYFLRKEGKDADLELKGLTQIYQDIHIINTFTAQRLRSASKTDSTLNAIALLDIFTKALPNVIDESLQEIRYLFVPFLEKDSRK